MLTDVGELVGKNEFIQNCSISISSSNEYLCAFKNKQIIIWNIKQRKIVSLKEQLEDISCINFIEIAPIDSIVKKIICLIVGFTSGNISFISIPSGDLLMEQKLHNQKLIKIKLRSNSTIPIIKHEIENEDITLLYEDCTLVLIEGDIIMEILRDEYSRIVEKKLIQQSCELSFKKYRLKQVSGKILDVITTPCNGIREIKTGSLIITVGNNPMISVYLNSKDDSLISLASNVASKLTSSIYSFAKTFWGSSSQTQNEIEIKNPKSHGLSRESKFEDPTRNILCIIQDGTSKLGAFGDAFGRVCLLDLTYSPPLVIRMWKGYREPQLAFFQTSIPTISNKNQKNKINIKKRNIITQYLAIYAPRRGLLEIWKMRNGSRQAVFNVSDNCILINGSSCFGLDVAQEGIQNCYLFYKNTGKLQKVSVDPSLFGISERSQQEFKKFMKIIEKLEEKTFTNEELLESRKQLLLSIKQMDGPDQFFMIVQKLLSISYSEIGNSESQILFPLDYFYEFISSVTKIIKAKMNPNNKSGRNSNTPHIIQQLNQIERIKKVIKTIKVLSKLNELYDGFTHNRNQNNNICKVMLDIDINEDTDSHDSSQKSMFTPFVANILLMNNFDVVTGHLKSNEDSIRDMFFQWMLLPQIESSVDLFLQLFDDLLIDTFELQSFFGKWYLQLVVDDLCLLSKWNIDENISYWSFQLFIENVLLNHIDNDIDIDPLDPLYHRCADSSSLYNVIILCKIIIDAYRKDQFNINRIYLQRWTVLKTNVCLLLNISSILPDSILSISPLSVASFETTTSLFHYSALLNLASSNFIENESTNNIDYNSIENQLKELFPKHYNITDLSSLISIHEIAFLATQWIINNEININNINNTNNTNNTNTIQSLTICMDKLKLLNDNLILQKGMALKLWKELFSPKLSKLVNLMEKIRKQPKQKLLIRTIGMNINSTLSLIQYVEELLLLLFGITKSDDINPLSKILSNTEDIWPPIYDSLYFQLNRISNDTACCIKPIEDHLTLLHVIQVIYKFNIDGIQPLQLFSPSISFFSSLVKETEIEISEDILTFMHSHRVKFLIAVMENDSTLGLQMANELQIEHTELLIKTVEWLYLHSCDTEAEKIMKLSNDEIFISILTFICKQRAKFLLLQQPYALEYLSIKTKKWIDNSYKEESSTIHYQIIEDNDKINQLQHEIELLDNIMEKIKSYEDEEQKELHQLCSIMKQKSFTKYYEKHEETEEEITIE